MSDRAMDRLRASVREFARAIDEIAQANEWVDQNDSPLGRRLHCQAARAGELKAKKLGSRWMARRSDVDAYIEVHGKKPPAERPETDDATAVAEILEFRAPRRKRGSRK